MENLLAMTVTTQIRRADRDPERTMERMKMTGMTVENHADDENNNSKTEEA